MRHTTNTVAVECGNCGKTGGSREGDSLRCGECGRFASETSGYCPVHNVNYERITG
jgi:tRNA(Ile2) C34 agmatinyltransferase TiaS